MHVSFDASVWASQLNHNCPIGMLACKSNTSLMSVHSLCSGIGKAGDRVPQCQCQHQTQTVEHHTEQIHDRGRCRCIAAVDILTYYYYNMVAVDICMFAFRYYGPLFRTDIFNRFTCLAERFTCLSRDAQYLTIRSAIIRISGCGL